MSRKQYLHIVLLVFGLFFYSETISAKSIRTFETVLVEQDSLQIDTASVEKRHFENLKTLYTGEDYVYDRTVESSGWWTRFKQWLSEFLRDFFKMKGEKQSSAFTDIALKIGAVVVILLVIFFIFKAVMNSEGKWVFGKGSDKNIIPVSDIEANIHATDFKTLIASAEAEHNYRLAIRYYYLWLLKDLTNAEIIEYDVEKTNSDYQNEISTKSLKDGFSYTSYLYNYIWYGEFDVNENEFNKAKDAFIQFLKSIKA
ncbi:DUF4129 domain-containing protein [Algibacter sp. L4_22]|uniref:DUF4129 domain-containing protein n=1 Tax=Algibacter sp. L4_22 TaxID=2942477 RepID=UPI00201B5A76|nr:DUF4129 domain-containing protein [Algibacter sp. L4_22]MCL5129720.1 DUF4129 domain-containing protein [Algibacter sp. L4_22]